MSPLTHSPRPPRPRASRRRRRQDRRGATVVEFAVVANVLFLMIFTCMEFARVNMIRNLAQDAAYFAARVVIVPGATPEEAEEEADRIMQSMITSGYTVTVGDIDEDSEDVSVTVSVDLDQVALFTPMFMGNATIESTAVMKTERYAGFYQQ